MLLLGHAPGPLLGFPLQGVSVGVVGLSRSEGTPFPLVCSCLAQAVHKASYNQLTSLYSTWFIHSTGSGRGKGETAGAIYRVRGNIHSRHKVALDWAPCLQVTVPNCYVGAVLSDLTSLRRAQVKGVSANESEGQSAVAALVPLASLLVSWSLGTCIISVFSTQCRGMLVDCEV